VSAEQGAAAALVARARGGERQALARALTRLEAGDADMATAIAAAATSAPRGRRVGFTGPPGAGKSTLIAAVAARLRSQGATVAILAVDPSSAFSGGAVLGDRVRMSALAGDPGVFVRSFAARGQSGGLAAAISEAADLVALAGFEWVLIETVGVGQGEIGVAGVVSAVVLVLVPEAGDEVQSLKAGLVEIADVIAVNKADRPGADALAADLRAALELRAATESPPPVLLTSASTGDGLDALMSAIAAAAAADPAQAGERRRRAIRAHLLSLVAAEVEREFLRAERSALDEAVEDVARGRRQPRRVAVELLAKLCRPS
jgi:LAO/AO transport system kinase